MKVLLAIEKTRISSGAIQILKKLFLPKGSSLFLLHVHSIPQKITGLAKERILKLSKHVQEVQKEELEQTNQFLSKVENSLRHQQVRFRSLVKKGFPGEEILKLIRTKGVDLVVLGTRSYSKVTGLVLGSVSQWVLQEAPCSVLIARNHPRKKLNDRTIKLLLATDGSSDAQAAIDFVNALELPPLSQITVLHVIKKQVYETELALRMTRKDEAEFAKLAEELFKARGREGAKLLKDTRKALSSHNVHVDEQLVYGKAETEILKSARNMKADLIVVGSRGLSGLKRMFLGSVSNKIVHHAGCSVAVIRRQNKK
ncbi:MAG: universal stress protein [Nitrospirales bacterium]|nr:MAG: universal stress protein [Nitrospirales bacterium]